MARLKEQPKEKVRETIPVPPELRSALCEVWELVQQAERDPDEFELDFDDAIQVPHVCGGRYGEGLRPYVLSYYPPSQSEGRWQLEFAECEIEDIADGVQHELSLYRCADPDCSFKSNRKSALCSHCDYVPDDAFAELPPAEAGPRLAALGMEGVHEASSRAEIIGLFGDPQDSGGDQTVECGLYVWPWIKYVRADCQVRFEFNKQGALREVFIMPADWQPGD